MLAHLEDGEDCCSYRHHKTVPNSHHPMMLMRSQSSSDLTGPTRVFSKKSSLLPKLEHTFDTSV